MKGLDDTFDSLSIFLENECAHRGIQGTFAAVDMRTDESISNIRWSLICMDTPLKLNRPDGKPDSNSLANVLPKIAMVIAHRQNTGGEDSKVPGKNEAKIRGEVPHQGGRISRDGEFGYAFSGALSEVDDELMQLVENYHLNL